MTGTGPSSNHRSCLVVIDGSGDMQLMRTMGDADYGSRIGAVLCDINNSWAHEDHQYLNARHDYILLRHSPGDGEDSLFRRVQGARASRSEKRQRGQ